MSIEIEVAPFVHVTEPIEINARRMRLQRPDVISGGYETEFKNLYATNTFLWDGEICFKCEGGCGEAVSLESGVQYRVGQEQRVAVVAVSAKVVE